VLRRTPSLSSTLGIGGAWISQSHCARTLSTDLRGDHFGFLGYGFYLVYRKPKAACVRVLWRQAEFRPLGEDRSLDTNGLVVIASASRSWPPCFCNASVKSRRREIMIRLNRSAARARSLAVASRRRAAEKTVVLDVDNATCALCGRSSEDAVAGRRREAGPRLRRPMAILAPWRPSPSMMQRPMCRH